MNNKLTDLAIEVLLVEKDIPLRIDYSKEDPLYRFNINDFSVYIFEQTWGSTALGFGGMGGQAMTTANTIVLIPINNNQDCFVYFAGRFAYSVPYSDIFGNDVMNYSVVGVNQISKYINGKKAEEN